MGTTTVTWIKDKQFVSTDSTSHSIVISSTSDNVGMKPSELLQSALGSCTAFDVVNVLTKRRQKLVDLEVSVEGTQQEENPWTFTHFHIHYKFTGVNLDPKEVEKAIHLSEEKYCSVSATLSKAAEITWDYEIVDAADYAPYSTR